jgi:hypothetical protein
LVLFTTAAGKFPGGFFYRNFILPMVFSLDSETNKSEPEATENNFDGSRSDLGIQCWLACG